MDTADCCVCEATFPVQCASPCDDCPDDWICSDTCLARHHRMPWHQENHRSGARSARMELAAPDGGPDLWRATLALNRSLRRQVTDLRAALRAAHGELAELRSIAGSRGGDQRP